MAKIDENSMLPVGYELDHGLFSIENYVSSGGFGNVYRAVNNQLGRVVAIKEFYMQSNCARDVSTGNCMVSTLNLQCAEEYGRYLEKFKAEAGRMRLLRHPKIAAVYSLFEENGTAYYEMEWVDGESLEDKLSRNGALPEQEAENYLRQLLDALDAVHSAGLRHLDIKPANVLVTTDGTVKLIDFGASKLGGPADEQQRNSSTLMGTPGYVPPEQATGGDTFEPCTDYYAVGATAYRLLTAQKPPEASSIINNGTGAFDFSGVSPRMQKFIASTMQPQQKMRPQNHWQMLSLLDGRDESDATVKLTDTVTRTLTEQQQGKTKDKSNINLGLVIVILLLVLSLLVMAVAAKSCGSESESIPSEAASTTSVAPAPKAGSAPAVASAAASKAEDASKAAAEASASKPDTDYNPPAEYNYNDNPQIYEESKAEPANGSSSVFPSIDDKPANWAGGY